MIRFTRIIRTVKSYLVEVLGIGGTTQNRFISPKGLYSKPKAENGIAISLSGGSNQDVIIAIQKEIELEENDVYLTDDKNFIHFKFKDGIIEIQGDTVFDDNVTIKKTLTVNKIICLTTIDAAGDISANGISVTGHRHDETGTITSVPIP